MFEAHVAKRPDAVALVYRSRQWSYAELDERANRLAHDLVSLGVGPENVVALCLPRGDDLVVGVLAASKAGAAFLPVDTTVPEERIGYILRDAVPSCVLTAVTTAHLVKVTSEAGTPTVIVDDPDTVRRIGSRPTTPVLGAAGEGNMAYVIYTSGSTGRPKGVVVTHRGVSTLVETGRRQLRTSAHTRVLQFSSPGFDAMILEFTMSLLVGGRLVVLPDEPRMMLDSLDQLVREQGITHALLGPAVLAAFESRELATLEVLILGGEALSAETADRWCRDRTVVNAYGPTEFTVCATISAPLVPGGGAPIGTAVDGARLHILDHRLQPVHRGQPGELYASGESIARGYLGRAAETATRFVADPFGPPGSRMYRTGDLVLEDERGQLVFLGRVDDQVQIRGHRIEPDEVKNRLLAQADVEDAFVMAREDVTGRPQLVAYVVPGGSVPPDFAVGLRERLNAVLPSPMVPSAVVLLDSLPVTVNGKIDRDRLPAPDFVNVAIRPNADKVGADGLVGVITGVLAEFLGLERVPAEASFFDLGGDSVLAVRVVNRLRDLLDVDVSVRDLFEAPRPADLVDLLGSRPTDSRGAIACQDRIAPLPLSAAQSRLWLVEQFEGPSALYNIPLVYEVLGPLDLAALDTALRDVVTRHEVLRTVIEESGGRPIQRALNGEQVPPILETRSADTVTVEVLVAEAAQHVFDLEADVPLLARVFELAPERHILVIVVHHIAADGWSIPVLMSDLATAYAARLQRRTPDWTSLPVQYADFAVWQRAFSGDAEDPGSRLSRHLAYWREQLADLPDESALPRDHLRPTIPTRRAGTVNFAIDAGTTAGLVNQASRHGATLFMACAACVAGVLSQATGTVDMPIGTLLSGRDNEMLNDLVGFFVNTVVMRIDVSGQPSFDELLSRVRKTVLECIVYQGASFDEVVACLRPPRVAGRNPLFQVSVAMEPEGAGRLELFGVRIERRTQESTAAKFDLAFTFRRDHARLMGTVEYTRDLFEHATVERLVAQLVDLCAASVRDPGAPVMPEPSSTR
jgi:amino acid adenylation domain-containing protein